MFELIKYRMIILGMLIINKSFNKLFLFVKIVVRFYLNPKNDDINFCIEFIIKFFTFLLRFTIYNIFLNLYYVNI